MGVSLKKQLAPYIKKVKPIVREIRRGFEDRNLGMLAASIAYGGTLAFFPLVVASVAIASSIIKPEQLREVVYGLEYYLPKDISSLVTTQITNAMEQGASNIWIAAIAIGIAVFGVSGAMHSIISAVNIAYGIKDSRGLVKVRLLSIAFSFVMIIGMLTVLMLVMVGDDMLIRWNFPAATVTAFSFLRWVLLALIAAVGVGIFYRYAPDRKRGEWKWISWGSAVATSFWLLGTVLFFVYIQYFARLSDSYSLFAGIIALMLWLNFSGLALLVGAQVDKALEKSR